ncbi:MAG: ABC transporter ATP-binding protein [Myxococcota bacterium]|nr:ABC transporter ATP-binding protein [Myxococcota bacterium]
MSTVSRILGIIAPRWGLAAGTLACMLAGSATTAAYALLAGPMLIAVGGPSSESGFTAALLRTARGFPGGLVAGLAATLLAVTVARGVAAYGQRMLTTRLGQDVVRRVRERMYEHLLRAAPRVLVSQRRGELASRLSSDALQVQNLVASNLAAVVGDLVTLAALAGLAFALDTSLALIALAGVPPIALVVAWLSKKVRRAHRAVWERYGELASHAAELGDKVPVIRAYGAEAQARRGFEAQTRALERLSLDATRWTAIAGPLVQLAGALALVVALGVAAERIASGALDASTFVSFFAAMFFVYRPVQGLGATVQRVASGLGALDRVEEVLSLELEPADPPGAREVPPMETGLSFRGVRFAYHEGRPVLDGVDLDIRRGESLAIVGPSGEGKTTLLLVLLGILDADAGEVRLDGLDARETTRASWRAQFAWVTQEPLLFGDTVLANVTLSEEAPDRARAERCLEMAGATPLLRALDGGLDHILAEGGKGLSGGERQRICIARALYRDAPVLVFDEATSSLDGPSERAIAETLERLMGERTVVVVSHRLSTVQRADRVVVIESGRVVEAGAPAQLWETPGRFRALFADAPPTVRTP